MAPQQGWQPRADERWLVEALGQVGPLERHLEHPQET